MSIPRLPESRPALIRAASWLLDIRLGIVPRVFESAREPGSPEFFHFYAEAAATADLNGVENFTVCGGASRYRDNALAKTIGEGVERYCSAMYVRDEFPVVSYERAPFRCVEPESFALYSAEQYSFPDFPLEAFDRATPVRWCAALDALTLETIRVPAAMVFVPYCYDLTSDEAPIVQPISTGLACQESYESACVAAACEAIERDAFTITWLAMMPRRRIRAESLDPSNADLLARICRARYDVTMFDMTTDISIPTILSVARHDAESEPALVVAAAAHPNARTALRKSLEELEQTRFWAKKVKARMPSIGREQLGAIDSQADHLRFWCERENVELGSFLFDSEEECDLGALPNLDSGNPSRQLSTVIEAIRRVGLRLFLIDLTTPDVRSLGLRVVRAIVPGLHPLVVGHQLRALGGQRLYEVPERLGFGKLVPGHTNPAPHPFP